MRHFILAALSVVAFAGEVSQEEQDRIWREAMKQSAAAPAKPQAAKLSPADLSPSDIAAQVGKEAASVPAWAIGTFGAYAVGAAEVKWGDSAATYQHIWVGDSWCKMRLNLAGPGVGPGSGFYVIVHRAATVRAATADSAAFHGVVWLK